VQRDEGAGQPASPRITRTGEQTKLPAAAREAAATIERTLADLGAPGHVVAATVGPTITRFGIAPAIVERYAPDGTLRRRERVRVAKILARANDLALALGARSLRLEAPVPGQSYVGLEVPNQDAASVTLASLLADRAFKAFDERAALPVALGRDVAGRPIFADLARLPHLLVAGATGSGKSVALNGLLAALLGRRTPDQLRLVVVDPKRVEFGWLDRVAHLLAPVAVEAQAAVEVLGKLETEMGRRYDLLAGAGVRDLAGYNAAKSPQLPYLVVMVDELADLMMLVPEEVERVICRLAQLGRAAGIHLVVATQRPSVDVLTGLIKANLPARLAFAVASQVDSRTILDSPGAELLLGRGDCLYLPPDLARPIRGQGAYVPEEDLARLARRCRRKRGQPDPYAEGFTALQTMAERAAAELFERARALAEAHSRVSASFLQRKLRIGYAKAKDLMERLRDEGVVQEDEDE
jgi:S-DNA-T family DNA segregation ATPase FtsK/SpoIIIE